MIIDGKEVQIGDKITILPRPGLPYAIAVVRRLYPHIHLGMAVYKVYNLNDFQYFMSQYDHGKTWLLGKFAEDSDEVKASTVWRALSRSS